MTSRWRDGRTSLINLEEIDITKQDDKLVHRPQNGSTALTWTRA